MFISTLHIANCDSLFGLGWLMMMMMLIDSVPACCEEKKRACL